MPHWTHLYFSHCVQDYSTLAQVNNTFRKYVDRCLLAAICVRMSAFAMHWALDTCTSIRRTQVEYMPIRHAAAWHMRLWCADQADQAGQAHPGAPRPKHWQIHDVMSARWVRTTRVWHFDEKLRIFHFAIRRRRRRHGATGPHAACCSVGLVRFDATFIRASFALPDANVCHSQNID